MDPRFSLLNLASKHLTQTRKQTLARLITEEGEIAYTQCDQVVAALSMLMTALTENIRPMVDEADYLCFEELERIHDGSTKALDLILDEVSGMLAEPCSLDTNGAAKQWMEFDQMIAALQVNVIAFAQQLVPKHTAM